MASEMKLQLFSSSPADENEAKGRGKGVVGSKEGVTIPPRKGKEPREGRFRGSSRWGVRREGCAMMSDRT